MAILGITNRTENWKTARYFAPLPERGIFKLARQLLPEGKHASFQEGEVHLELFWRGMRDHLNEEKKPLKEEEGRLAELYRELFPSLREEVEAFGGLQKLKAWNYDVSGEKGPWRLANNLRNTEIDIVLASPNHLFIGEAKNQSRFRGDSRLALPHQLVRQYVMASVLLRLRCDSRTVVPFVVGPPDIERQHEVLFMCEQPHGGEGPWMRKENILTWSDIEALW